MFSKWKIKGIEGYVFGEDKKLYKLPFESNGKHYGIKEVKLQKPSRYWLKDQWYSKRKLKSKLYIDPEPIELFQDIEYPF